MTLKSTTCFSKKTGKPLTEFFSEQEAEEGAAYANKTYGKNLAPYQCNNCNRWHLSPKDRQTPSIKCPECIDSNGYFKDLYESFGSAMKRASILYEERGISLKVYKCPSYDGWHLTKSC